MDIYTIQTVITTIVFTLFVVMVGAKQYFAGKAKNKMIVRVVYPNQEERPFLLKIQGNTTEVNKEDCAYHVTPFQEIDSPDVTALTKKYLEEDLTAEDAFKKAQKEVADNKGEVKKKVGSTFETRWPEGLPHWLQVRVRGMETPKGNPCGINFYSDEKLRLTDSEVGLIHRNAYVAAAISTSNDTREILEEIKKQQKPKSNVVIYILIGIAVVAAVGAAFMAYQNGVAISELRWW